MWNFKVFNLLLSLFVLIGPACQNEETAQSERPDVDGFQRMADSIDAIYARTNFEQNIYENKKRAQLFRRKVQQNSSANNIFQYARELLNSGQTERAIRVIEQLKSSNPALTRNNKNAQMLNQFLGICYLRLAEQKNCMNNHNDASCIVPIREGGYHLNELGSQKAIEHYKSVLSVDPEDMQSRWLLNLAYMTLDRYPEEVPEEYLIALPDQSTDQNIQNIATRSGLDHYGLCGGAITDDFNNDGLLDIIVSSWGFDGSVHYFQNEGENGFSDLSEESALHDAVGGLNIKQADYNNDGNTDFLIMRGAWKPNVEWGIPSNSLIKNNGDGTFEDVTFQAGLYSNRPTQSVAWLDFNNDGWLDLFIANETTRSSRKGFPCELYKNNGDGTFDEVATERSVDFVGYFKGVTSGDINNDGWPDLYLANLDGKNKLLLNRYEHDPDDPFKNIAGVAGVEDPNAAFPAWFFDYNNDGWEDIYVASYGQLAFTDQSGQFARDVLGHPVQTESNRLYRNEGNLQFEDVTSSHFEQKSLSTMGCNYGDVNNDGYPDFYLGTGAPDYRSVVPNRFFLNREGRRFVDKTFALGMGHIQKGHGISFADLNNDGSQDIYAVMGGAFQGDKFPNAFYRNEGNANHWIKLKLEGTSSNRSAIGAKVKVVGKGIDDERDTIYKTVNSGASFGANPLRLHIGLGGMEKIEDVAVRWPGGRNEFSSAGPVATNRFYFLKEGNAPEPVSLDSFDYDTDAKRKTHTHHMMQ